MSDTPALQFELVSPEEKLVSEPVKLAVIPGEEGELGIGADHASLVASLKPGVVALYKNSMSDTPRRIFIAGGFADVTGTNCTILAEEAIDIANMDKGTIKQQIKDLEEDLGMASERMDQVRIQRKLDMAKAKLSAIAGKVVL